MLNKLLAKIKRTDPATITQGELVAMASIETIEKTLVLLTQIEARKAVAPKGSPRYALLCKQHEQATTALNRHQLEAERTRVTEVCRRDQEAAEQALTAATTQHATACDSLQVAQTKMEAISKRIQPLEAELTSAHRAAEATAAAAQTAMNEAIASDDASAETIASNNLYQAQQVLKNNIQGGPLWLRIVALRNERIAAAAIVQTAEKSVAEAARAQIEARAGLALIQYDIQAQKLLDAYTAQRIAVAEAAAFTNGPHVQFKSLLNGRAVNLFEVQVSTPERIVFGSKIDGYSNRKLPAYACETIIQATRSAPDLRILATNAESVSAESEQDVTAEDDATESQQMAVVSGALPS